MSSNPNPPSTPRRVGHRSLAVATVLTIIATLFTGLSPAGAALESDAFGSTWGVRGLRASEVSIGYHVRSMITIGDTVYASGRFDRVVAPDGSTRDQSFVAAFNAGTGEWNSAFRPSVNGPVHSLAASSDGSTLYLGGEFTQVNGAAQRGLVAVDPSTGATKTGFDVTLGATGQGRARVMAIEAVGDDLIIGGEWLRINGVRQARVGRVNQVTGVLDETFDPTVLGGQVLALEHSSGNGRVYLAGQFHSVDGNGDLRYFVALDSAGTPVSQPLFDDPNLYHPSENINGYSLLEVGDTLFVGTSSNLLFVLDRATLARRFHWGAELDAWNIDRSWHGSDVQTLVEFDGSVYAGSHIRWIGQPGQNAANGFADSRTNEGTPANLLTRFSPAGEIDPDFLPIELRGSVWASTDSGNGCLWFGGNISVPGYDDWNLARMCDDGPVVPGQTHAPFYNDAKFVIQQYLDVYGRRPSSAEVAAKLAQGANDNSKSADVVAGMIGSGDMQAARQVTRVYLGLFERVPDQEGLQYWIAQRRSGLSLEAMINEFLASPEFAILVGKVENRDFSAEVYRRVLDREPDQAGLDYWEGELDRGYGRNSLVLQFTESIEFRNSTNSQVAVVLAYSSMLRRTPTVSEAQTWIGNLKAGRPYRDLIASIYGSTEYRSRVAALPTSRP